MTDTIRMMGLGCKGMLNAKTGTRSARYFNIAKESQKQS